MLTPGQWDRLHVIAERVVQQRAAGESGAKHVTIQFIGTQHPTAEQMASIKREMGLALSGA